MSDNAAPQSTPASTESKSLQVKPEKPDEDQYQKDLETAKKELSSAQDVVKAAQAKVNLARPGNKDSPTAQRQQELRSQLTAIKQKQQGIKNSRGSVQDKIKILDGQLKSRINEQKAARSKIPFKSTDEIDREIQRLEKQVDTGTMKLVDEKKALTDITALRKQRKAFNGFDDAQKNIDDVKAQIAELKKGMDDPESKALSDEFAAAAKELDEIKSQQDTAFKSLNNSRNDLTKARAVQEQKYAAVKAIQDKYYSDKRAYHDYEREATRQRQARRKAENDAYFKQKRLARAAQTLEDASAPAYAEDIRSAKNILQRLDPNFVTSTTLSTSGKFAATAQRTVEVGEFKGTKVVKKSGDEEEYFQGTGSKKGKKAKKPAGEGMLSSSTNNKVDLGFFMSPGVLKEMSLLEIDVPSSQSDIPNIIDKLKEKLKFYEGDQERKTKENVEIAMKEIDRLEAEANESADATPAQSSRKAAGELSTTNGSTPAADAGVTEATGKLAETSIQKDVVNVDPVSNNEVAATPAKAKAENE